VRILYLDCDTTRPDHLGCYGYARHTSPHIDRVAAEGVRFTRVYASDAPCLPSRTALSSGQFGIRTGVVGHGGTTADRRPEGIGRRFADITTRDNLASFLRREAGLRTVLFSPFAWRHSAWQFQAGFHEVVDTGGRGMESAEDVLPGVLDWLDRRGHADDWFLHVNLWDAHTPYRAPPAAGDPFADHPLPRWLTHEVLAHHRTLPGPHKPRELNMWDNATDPRWPRHPGELRDLADLRQLFDGYDTGIHWMDKHIGQLFAWLDAAGLWDDTAVIVSADHGENMGELGIYAEHGTADDATCRVPLLLKWPGGRTGAVADGLHYALDLVPTLAELLGCAPRTSWDGVSFAGAVTGSGDAGRSELVLSQCAHVCQRSVRFDDCLYIRTWHDGFHLFPTEMLFDLSTDPHEQHDLAQSRPEVCAEAAHRLLTWTDAALAKSGWADDPLWQTLREGGPEHARGELAAYVRYLEVTDRGHWVAELRRRHPREFATVPVFYGPG
jgi:choline-sulfatase